MNFLDQRKELATQLGVDQTNSEMDTRLKRWLNMSQRVILSAYNWEFLRASNPYIFQTVPDYSTGTVSTSASSSSITFSGTVTPTALNKYIKFSYSNDWYRISAHTDSTASATIDPSAISTNGASTFLLRKIYYSLTSDVDRIIQIRQFTTPVKLLEMTKEMFDSINPYTTTTGNPSHYMVVGKDSNDVWQIMLWPTPSSVMNMQVEYLKKVSDLTSDSEESIIPEKWNSTVMIEGAKMYGYTWLDDTRSSASGQIFEKMLMNMIAEHSPSKSIRRVMRAIDEQPWGNEFPYPAEYPRGS